MADIYPFHDKIIPRSGKEARLGQKARVIWFTGLSGSGKTTLSLALEKYLFEIGYLTQILDGDNIRSGINNNLGFSVEDRLENIRRIAEVAKLFLNCGVITICAFISPTEETRKQAKEIIGEGDFIEIYVSTPIEECERRDIKGLYARARQGEIKEFTGISSVYEAPSHPFMSLNTMNKSVDECIEAIVEAVMPEIAHQGK
jgi:adenylylsulfate kinase